MKEESYLTELKNRVNYYLNFEDECEAITLIEDEIEDIVKDIFNELKVDKNTVMKGNAEILFAKKGGFIIKTDNNEKHFMYESSYKGSSTEKGTRIHCGKFKIAKRGSVCIDAQECLSLIELKYHMFSYIEDRNMVKASSAAWAIYKDASTTNQEKMKLCIHALRNFMRIHKMQIAC